MPDTSLPLLALESIHVDTPGCGVMFHKDDTTVRARILVVRAGHREEDLATLRAAFKFPDEPVFREDFERDEALETPHG